MSGRHRWHEREGAAEPLGATWTEDGQALNFALYSKHATSVTLLLYAGDDTVNPCFEWRLEYPTHKSGRIWHGRVPASVADRASYYAYRVEGPWDPAAGHRFDPYKILLDPYARAVAFPPGFDRSAACRAGSNAGRAPLGVLPRRGVGFDWGSDVRPVHTHDAVIYELHVGGFTRSPSSGVSPSARGTYAGVIEKIPYLRELGVTVVELMPVFQFDPFQNYWGYMPLSFFAPHLGYSQSGDPRRVGDEFREMVRALHAADIEVVLDVVYTHTSEGNEAGPTFGFRGIDNSTYYLLEEDRARYRNDAGTGNVLHCANRYVRHMILDSLRFWVTEMHVDGFRFDLASLFTRDEAGRINLEDPPIVADIGALPDFAGIRLIAEAWDLAAYQLGRSFPGTEWLQWNGRFRDDVRCFVRGDAGQVPALMTRLYGSDDIFPDQVTHAYHAYQSVNFVTSHDGLTMHDLVSYAVPIDRDAGGWGSDISFDCGWSGEHAPAEVRAERQRRIRLLFTILFVSNGTPMFVAGDELGRSQAGRANPYDRDEPSSWIDWDLAEANAGLLRFVRIVLAFRRAHPSLCRSRFWRADVAWRGPEGSTIDLSADAPGVGFFLDGGAEQDGDVFTALNRADMPLRFVLDVGSSQPWLRVVDTARPSPDDACAAGDEVPITSASIEVAPRSAVVLLRHPAPPAG